MAAKRNANVGVARNDKISLRTPHVRAYVVFDGLSRFARSSAYLHSASQLTYAGFTFPWICTIVAALPGGRRREGTDDAIPSNNSFHFSFHGTGEPPSTIRH